MKQKNVLYSIVVILTFCIVFYGRKMGNSLFDDSVSGEALQFMYSFIWWTLPALIVIGFLYGFGDVFSEIRLSKGFVVGIVFAFVSVLPMLIGYAVVGDFNTDLSAAEVLKGSFMAGFLEEFLFRGFLFGLLFRKLNWGFVPAAMFGAVIFGLGHIYQGSTVGQSLGVFGVTFLGAVWFAWLFIEWKENLWVPILLHIFMNLSWLLFSVSENALGGVYANVFRAATIIITIVVTISYCKRKGGFSINKGNLLVN